MTATELEKKYEDYVKECVRNGRIPKTPDEFLEYEAPSIARTPGCWVKTREQELLFAQFQNVMMSGGHFEGVNVTLKCMFDGGVIK